MEIQKPYLLMTGDSEDYGKAKTAYGLRDWTPEDCVGQWRFNASAVDLGLPEMTPAQAVAAGAKTVVIGIAPSGGQLPESWHAPLAEALRAGLDLAAGLHHHLNDIPALVETARSLGRQLHDVRLSGSGYTVASGEPRPGKRLLTVGTDCALGKKYTALAIAREMSNRGAKADFRATGQTGILLAGGGIAIDTVVADFISGAAESISPANDPDHWDIIEGQGSLFHPAYAGVTTGLIHGSQADVMVLCHDPSRETVLSYPRFPLPTLFEAMDAYLRTGRLTNAAVRFIGIALNTSKFDEDTARELIDAAATETGLPCVDPIRTGVAAIVDALEAI